MNTAAATPDVAKSDAPMRRVTLDVFGINITLDAEDVMRLLIERMRAGSSRHVIRIPPIRIGAAWPEQGGTYAGIVRGDDGASDYHLIAANEARGAGPWKDAVAWAKSLTVDGFNDYTLPKRKEQAVLFGQVPELFEREWYWSGEEHTNNEYAWYQYFLNGTQGDGHESSDDIRARAVRRVPIS